LEGEPSGNAEKRIWWTLEALREAQLSILRGKIARGLDLDAGRDNTRLPPYYWAAFVLAGDWR
jgi:CHAT domain-containing protein